MAVCYCSMAGTAACQHCASNPFATNVYSNTVITDHIEQTLTTNFDLVRRMSVEEFADFMLGVTQRGGIPPVKIEELKNGAPRWLDWLQQEVESDD